MEQSSFFTPEEEAALVDWIKLIARKRFPIKNNLILCARRLTVELKKDNNGRKKWFLGFMKRHLDITRRVNQNLIKA